MAFSNQSLFKLINLGILGIDYKESNGRQFLERYWHGLAFLGVQSEHKEVIIFENLHDLYVTFTMRLSYRVCSLRYVKKP
jgi:hypothetical protein